MKRSKPIKVRELIKFDSMPKTLEQLKQVIQAANPEIMELKFGCEVIYERKKCKYLHHIEGWFDVLLPPNYDKGILQVTNPKLKIFGRPIRLADVLLAIEKNTRPPEKYMISTNGIITFRESKEITAQVFNSRFLSAGVSWNLKDDNLDHQSGETKQFLIDLLIP